MWREGLYAYNLLIFGYPSPYRHHPAFREFEQSPGELRNRLQLVQIEMLKREYHPKKLPEQQTPIGVFTLGPIHEWKTFDEQIEILKHKRKTIKNCKCKIYDFISWNKYNES